MSAIFMKRVIYLDHYSQARVEKEGKIQPQQQITYLLLLNHNNTLRTMEDLGKNMARLLKKLA